MLCLIWPLSAHADSDFHSKYQVNYTYGASGHSRIVQKISLTNLVSSVYATSYQLIVQGEAPQNLSGSDSKGPLKITTTRQDTDSTLIAVEFNDKVVGRDKTLNFSLAYDGKDATHNGQVWEIIIPKLGSLDQIDEYEANLIIPADLGQLAFVSPKPQYTSGNIYHFTKDQLTRAGVVAAFGNFQTFGFKLTYHLDNDSDKYVYSEIALPPDTNYQRVFFDSLDPAPINVRMDEDGNWLARYDLDPNQKLTVIAAGQAHLLAEPSSIYADVTDTPLSNYLKPTKYWQTMDPEIRSIAKNLSTPKDVYDYVVKTLEYDYSRIGVLTPRKGALETLKTPKNSVCSEFTDLFVTLARSVGIPTREVNGFAYTTDSSVRPLSLGNDILHAWPQYWSTEKKMWINVDPTWGNTTGGVDYFYKLDFNHFTFAIHGVSDEEPLAAGQYKQNTETHDVQVEFVPYKDYSSRDLQFNWKRPGQILPFKSTSTLLQLTNVSGQAIYDTNIEVEPVNFQIQSNTKAQFSVIPPFASVDMPVNIKPGDYFNISPKSLTIRAGEQSVTYNIPGRAYLGWQISVAVIFSALILSVAYAASRAWSLHLQRRERQYSLRGESQEPKK